jgi:hypothetical protein
MSYFEYKIRMSVFENRMLRRVAYLDLSGRKGKEAGKIA